ncbi:unnamed protein product [Ixodes pacificus]
MVRFRRGWIKRSDDDENIHLFCHVFESRMLLTMRDHVDCTPLDLSLSADKASQCAQHNGSTSFERRSEAGSECGLTFESALGPEQPYECQSSKANGGYPRQAGHGNLFSVSCRQSPPDP